MKQDDLMKRLRKAALVLPVLAMPVLATPAFAQRTDEYKVVINHEEQYSIWPIDRDIPAGWNNIGQTGTLEECQDYIEEVWTDMRPLSLRKKIIEQNPKLGKTPYKVVINHEEQYSIWLADRALRGKWRETGETCSLNDCMSYIKGVWTDMRPLSLRKNDGK